MASSRVLGFLTVWWQGSKSKHPKRGQMEAVSPSIMKIKGKSHCPLHLCLLPLLCTHAVAVTHPKGLGRHVNDLGELCRLCSKVPSSTLAIIKKVWGCIRYNYLMTQGDSILCTQTKPCVRCIPGPRAPSLEVSWGCKRGSSAGEPGKQAQPRSWCQRAVSAGNPLIKPRGL